MWLQSNIPHGLALSTGQEMEWPIALETYLWVYTQHVCFRRRHSPEGCEHHKGEVDQGGSGPGRAADIQGKH